MEGRKRGRETARTPSATDRKIKEHDALGSRTGGIVLCDARKNELAEGMREVYKKSRVHHASAPSPGIAKFLAGENSSETICSDCARGKYVWRGYVFLYRRVPRRITLLLLLRIKRRVDAIVLLSTYLPPSAEVAVNVTICNKKKTERHYKSGMSIVEFAILR